MCNFTLKIISPNGATIAFFKLLENGKCYHDEFWADTKKSGNNGHLLNSIQTVIDLKSRKQPVSPKQWLELRGRDKGDAYPDFEIRKGDLRLYCFFDDEFGYVTVNGALKKPKDQEKEISKMRAVKLRYFECKQNKTK